MLHDLLHNLHYFARLFFALASAVNDSYWNSGQVGTLCPSAMHDCACTRIPHTLTHAHTCMKMSMTKFWQSNNFREEHFKRFVFLALMPEVINHFNCHPQIVSTSRLDSAAAFTSCLKPSYAKYVKTRTSQLCVTGEHLIPKPRAIICCINNLSAGICSGNHYGSHFGGLSC